jgi:ADP-ribose pyrophosphatase YjhB (NUDIX family)
MTDDDGMTATASADDDFKPVSRVTAPPLFRHSFYKKNVFCNNCGKNGHLMHACKHPITSNGIIVFKDSDEGAAYLMIRRKDTLGFVEFIRGKYPLYNRMYLQRLIDEMTVDEKRRLQTQTFSELWTNVWGEYLNSKYQTEETVSCERFNLLKKGIKINRGNGGNSECITLSDLIEKSSTQWGEPEWGFPKGRRNYQERDLDCALREFSEETGYDSSKLVVMQNIVPYEEIFMGSNVKTYKHKYYVAYFPLTQNANANNNANAANANAANANTANTANTLNTTNTTNATNTTNTTNATNAANANTINAANANTINATASPKFQKTEVSKMEWFSFDECVRHIRPYNLEKINILRNLNDALKEYEIVC